MSNEAFVPKVNQGYHGGLTGGISLRYKSEKYFSTICSIMGEINYSQIGWKEDITDSNNQPVINAKTGLAEKFETIARMCSTNVTVPSEVGCCGFAGDRGFTFPELNQSALRHLKKSIPSDTKLAFSTSKTCEIGLSEESGLDYRSIFYLVERCIN